MNEVYSGIRTMFKSEQNDFNKKYCIAGVPFDGTTTYRPGTRFGPSSIREASLMLCDGVDYQTKINVCELVTDIGDFSPKEIKSINADNDLILLGGEHSITYHALERAFIKKEEEKINLLHFDAHCDTWDSETVEHGSFLRHALEDGFVGKILQYGIRSPAPEEVINYNNSNVFDGHYTKMNKVLDENEKWYITIDIDCFDPSFAPGTGTPESFGLSPKFVLKKLLKFIQKAKALNIDIVGFDVVEVNPMLDNSNITSILAANLIWKYIAYREFYFV